MSRPTDHLVTNEPAGSATEQRDCGARGGLRGERGGVVGWMSRHPLLLACAGLLLTASLGVFAFDRNAENRYQRKLREIRARGEPTTVEELIAATPGLPDEENQLLIVLKAARSVSLAKLDDEQRSQIPILGVGRLEKPGVRWSPQQASAVREFLAAQTDELDELRRTARSGRGLFRPTFASPMISSTWPELSEIRKAVKILILASLEAAGRGDAESALQDLKDAYAICDMFDGRRSLIAGLTKIGTLALACDAIQRTVNAGQLSDQALEELSARVRISDNSGILRDMFVAERVMFIDTIAWVAGGGGGAIGLTGPPSGLQWVPGFKALNGVEGLNLFDELIAAAEAPTDVAVKRVSAISASVQTQPWYLPLAKLLVPSFDRLGQLWARAISSQRAMIAALAAERYRLAHGDWPATLDALTPGFLDAVPLDPFDRRPLRYARIAEGVKVWSIGEDLVDDGGDVEPAIPPSGQASRDCGWVILDPPLRGRPAE